MVISSSACRPGRPAHPHGLLPCPAPVAGRLSCAAPPLPRAAI